MEIQEAIHKQYGGRIRLRVCGILENNGEYLLINHTDINNNQDFWCGPGGGVEFGETIAAALKREFWEETNLTIEVGKFLGIYEYIQMPLHAVEVFYQVKLVGGELKLGKDPEHKIQIINKLEWFSVDKMKELPEKSLHQHFKKMFL